MASKIQQLWARIGLPAFWSAPAKAKTPPTKVVGRTGDARYVPQMAHWATDKRGTTTRIASRMDDVRIQDYDRARFYPVVRDALKTLRAPLTRANVHFACQDQVIADLLTQELGPLLPELINTLVKGSMEFGWQVVEKRWVPKFNVSVSTGGQQGGQKSERIFPFIWTISRFASFSPQDTRILVNPRNGDFAGIRQFIRATGEDQDVPATKCVHFAYDKEYDGNYGVSAIKSAIPFIEAAESVYDSMTLYSQLFASPYKVGRYPGGKLPTKDAQGNSELIHNADLMEGLVTSLEGGHSIVLPSDMNDGGGYKWDLQFMEAPGGSDSYVDKLNHLNEMIRVSLAVPQYASSGTPDSGTYNLGESQINLFLQNAEAILDQLALCITSSVVEDFVNFNFGVDAPRARMYFEPLDQNVTKMLLQSLLQMLGSGQPMQDADGNMLYPDWGKIAQDKGVPIVQQEPQTMAQQLAQQAAQRLQGMGGGEAGGQQQPAPQQGAPNSVPEDLQLSEFDESKHPRKKDGKFAPKGGGEAGGGQADEGGDTAPASTKAPQTNRVVDRNWFKNNAEKLQDTGWTKGKKPNLIIADGNVFKIETTGAGEYTLIPATRADIMPAILKKIDDPNHRLHSLKAGLDGTAAVRPDELNWEPVESTTPQNDGVIDESHPAIQKVKTAHGNLNKEALANIKLLSSAAGARMYNLESTDGAKGAIAAYWAQKESDIKAFGRRIEYSVTQKAEAETKRDNETDAAMKRFYQLRVNEHESKIANHTMQIDNLKADAIWKDVDAMLTGISPDQRDNLTLNDISQLRLLEPYAQNIANQMQTLNDYKNSFEDNADVYASHAASIGETGENMPDWLHNEHVPVKHQNAMYNSFGQGVTGHYLEKAFSQLTPKGQKYVKTRDRVAELQAEYRREKDAIKKNYVQPGLMDIINPNITLEDGTTILFNNLPEVEALNNKYTPLQEQAMAAFDDATRAAKDEAGGEQEFRRTAAFQFKEHQVIANALKERHGPVTQTFRSAKGTNANRQRLVQGLKIYPERMRAKIESTIKQIKSTTSRARYEPNEQIIRVDLDLGTVEHEMAHALEDSYKTGASNRELDLSVEFLQRRAGTEQPSTIYRGTSERGYKDNFVNHYIGKVYKTNYGSYYATEIMSMGADMLTVEKSAEKLYKDDRDMFNYIVGRLAQK